MSELSLQEELKAVAEKHLAPKLAKRKELRKELSKLDAEIETAQNVIAGVSGKGKKKSNSAKSTGNRKPSPDVEKVTGIMIALLKQKNDRNRDDLEGKTKSKLTEEGFALTGLSNRFKKIFDNDARFAAKGKTITLAEKAA